MVGGKGGENESESMLQKVNSQMRYNVNKW